MGLFKRILVPVDGSEGSGKALDVALALAGDQSATVHFVHVIDRVHMFALAPVSSMADELLAAINTAGELLLGQAVERAREAGLVSSSALQVTDAACPRIADRLLREAAGQSAELIVCGSHGTTGFRAVLLGSVAEGLLRQSTLPVLMVPMR